MNFPKKHFRFLGLYLVAILFAPAYISGAAKQAQLPFDPAVKKGVLPNGLTYYIRHNEEPKNRVVLYLVNKVGSVLENENQRGLAHFMEHMSFNGTKNFPKNELVSYLEKSGVKFGGDLNAYTNFDETVYQLPLPTDDPKLLHNGYRILRDWAQNATLDSMEIEQERGVILEEKRLRSNVQQRMFEQYYPVLTNNSIYCQRIPIGTDEILKGFKRSTLVDFYKWYRPNLQAVIVVGDIDPAATEQTIKAMFSDLKNPKNAAPRPDIKISLNGKNQFFAAADKEITMPSLQLITKFQHTPLITKADYRSNIIRSLFNRIMSERFTDLSNRPGVPFVAAQYGVGDLAANLDACSLFISAQAAKMEAAFKTGWTEVVRLRRYGVTEGELQRAKKDYLNNIETAFNERSKTESDAYVNEYMRHFLENEAAPGIDLEYALTKELMPAITIADISVAARQYSADTNRDMLVIAAAKEELVTEATVQKWMKEIEATPIAAPEENKTAQSLIDKKPLGRKITKETINRNVGTTELTLANGVKIILKPTTFKNDEINFYASSPGGTSLYSDSEYASASAATAVVTSAGLGSFTLSELQKHLAGKRVEASPFISDRFEGINGSAAPADLETALQMVYLYFTQPRKDFTVFNAELEKTKATLATRSNNPASVFSDSLNAILFNYNIRRTGPSIEKINSINPERAYAIYTERFADASDFTFTFVGNFDTEKIKPLLEQYLGSLPAVNRHEAARNLGIHFPEGQINRKVYKGVDNKSTVRLILHGTYTYGTLENNKLDALADILTIKLTEKLREEEGGVYGVQASARYSKYPDNRYSITIAFGCAPANVDKLIQSTREVIAKLKKEKPAATDIEKVVNEDLRAMEVQLKTNSFWLNYLAGQQQNDNNPEEILTYTDRVKSITADTIQAAAQQYLQYSNFAAIVLYPEN